MSGEKEIQTAGIAVPRRTVPAKAEGRATGGSKNKKRQKKIIDLFRGEGVLGTEFRRISDRINWTADTSGKPTGPKQVLITSSVIGEGKSTVASFLSLTAAVYLDQKTLLLDCDLRRPMVHRLFGESLLGGVSDCLSGAMSFESCLRSTELDKLKILTAGTGVSDPTQVLTADGWADLVAEASFYFDRIVIDCAPVIPVNDAVVVGRAVDGMLMVVRAGNTQREVATRAAEIIRQSQLNLLGIVVNNIEEALPYYYNQKYYGYSYQRRLR